MRLTEEQKREIEKKVTRTQCRFCGGRLDYISDTIRLLPYDANYNDFLGVQCQNCGHIEFHNLDILLKNQRKQAN